MSLLPLCSPYFSSFLLSRAIFSLDWVEDTDTATTKWGDIGGWDVSGVKDFSYAFSKHRNEAGGAYVTDGNLKAATFTAASGMSKWITSAATTLKGTFLFAADFDVDLGNWDVSSVDTMYVRRREGGGKAESKTAAPVGWCTALVWSLTVCSLSSMFVPPFTSSLSLHSFRRTTMVSAPPRSLFLSHPPQVRNVPGRV